MNVLFAPDWRDGVPYQRLLAEALEERGVRVSFLRDYRRGLPLARLVHDHARREPVDVLHLHWPEAYYPSKGDWTDWFRCARWPLDLALARRGRALVLTAHNLHAHNRQDEPFARRNTRASLRQADLTLAHSEGAKDAIVQSFGLPPKRIPVIPHGDLSVSLGPPLPRAEARAALGLGPEQVALMFGAIEPYKGIEEVIAAWRKYSLPTALHIVGKPISPGYEASLRAEASGTARVHFQPGWMTDATLRQWLSATDCVIFNYCTIFTSGAACLARSYGVPILLPSRLTTVALDEPSPLVHRFAGAEDLPRRLAVALAVSPDYAAAAPWRTATAWPHIAEATARAYREALEARR